MSSKILRTFQPAIRSASTLNAPRILTSRHFHTSLPKMTVHNITTMEGFKETIAKHPVVMIDAFATWCGPCKAIAPQIAKWAQGEFKDKIYFAKFDVDDIPDLAQELGIRAMPTFIIFKDGEKVDEFTGANPPALLKVLSKWEASATA